MAEPEQLDEQPREEMAEHTRVPWGFIHTWAHGPQVTLTGPDGNAVLTARLDEQANHSVRAVLDIDDKDADSLLRILNAHPDLLAACEAASAILRDLLDGRIIQGQRRTSLGATAVTKLLARLEAAIAKATEKKGHQDGQEKES